MVDDKIRQIKLGTPVNVDERLKAEEERKRKEQKSKIKNLENGIEIRVNYERL